MASVTIRVHQPVLGWPSGSTHTVELTPLTQGLIDNSIAEVVQHSPDPNDAPEREDHIQPEASTEEPATDAPATPRRPRK